MLAQSGKRLREERRRRLAVVDVDGAAVDQHLVHVVVAAERVAPGQPVHEHRRFGGQERPGLQQHLLVRAEHAVGVDHALGRARGARREEQLGHGVGSDRIERLLHVRAWHRGHKLVEGGRARRDPVESGEGWPELLGVLGPHEAGRAAFGELAYALVVLRHQRVRHAHRHHRDARREAAQHQHQVLDRVAGQHHHRPLRVQAEVEQRLSDGVGLSARLAERDRAPVRLARQHPVRMQLRPPPHHMRDAALMLAQRILRAQQQRAVPAPLQGDPRAREQLRLRGRGHVLTGD